MLSQQIPVLGNVPQQTASRPPLPPTSSRNLLLPFFLLLYTWSVPSAPLGTFPSIYEQNGISLIQRRRRKQNKEQQQPKTQLLIWLLRRASIFFFFLLETL